MMLIDSVEALQLALPDIQAVGDGSQDSFFVRITTDAGVVGIGEGKSSPHVLGALVDAGTSTISCRGLREVLIGLDALDIDAAWRRMRRATANLGIGGSVLHAMSAVDMALWDIRGKVEGRPIWEMMEGENRTTVPVYASGLAAETIDLVLAGTRGLVADGFTAVKLGWGALGQSVDDDVALVATLRRALGPEIELMIDFGSPVSYDHAAAFVEGSVETNLAFIEEPFAPDDLDSYARLSKRKSRPAIATGEKHTSPLEFGFLMEHGRPDVVQPDLGRVGGFTGFRQIRDLAQRHGTTVIPHCWASDVLVAATLHAIACLPPETKLEYCILDHPLRHDVVREPIRQASGQVDLPQAPGLGVSLDEAVVEAHLVRRST